MTWAEWIDSEYNTENFTVSGSSSMVETNDDSWLTDDSITTGYGTATVYRNQTIKDGQTYTKNRGTAEPI